MSDHKPKQCQKCAALQRKIEMLNHIIAQLLDASAVEHVTDDNYGGVR
jgi:hypothetical protein